MRHHDGPLVGEGVVQVADDLNRHVGLACVHLFHNGGDVMSRHGDRDGTNIQNAGGGGGGIQLLLAIGHSHHPIQREPPRKAGAQGRIASTKRQTLE